jgi:hypothetical protein
MTSSSSSSDIDGTRSSRVARGVYIRFSEVLTPADSTGGSADGLPLVYSTHLIPVYVAADRSGGDVRAS